jgi:hypothetical protein
VLASGGAAFVAAECRGYNRDRDHHDHPECGREPIERTIRVLDHELHRIRRLARRVAA